MSEGQIFDGDSMYYIKMGKEFFYCFGNSHVKSTFPTAYYTHAFYP